jgi:hypothetical protein
MVTPPLARRSSRLLPVTWTLVPEGMLIAAHWTSIRFSPAGKVTPGRKKDPDANGVYCPVSVLSVPVPEPPRVQFVVPVVGGHTVVAP